MNIVEKPRPKLTSSDMARRVAARRGLQDAAAAVPKATSSTKPVPVAPPAATPTPGPQISAAKRRRFEQRRRLQKLLEVRYPLIFGWARPLAIGVHAHLRAAYSTDELTDSDLRDFLRWWTNRRPYKVALERGDRRVNLDGSDAGPAFTDTTAPAGDRHA